MSGTEGKIHGWRSFVAGMLLWPLGYALVSVLAWLHVQRREINCLPGTQACVGMPVGELTLLLYKRAHRLEMNCEDSNGTSVGGFEEVLRNKCPNDRYTIRIITGLVNYWVDVEGHRIKKITSGRAIFDY